MAKEMIKMNGTVIWQPDKDMPYSFATTYSEGSNRTQYGDGRFTPRIIAKGKTFTLHHYSLYHASWRDDPFYVGKSGNITIGELSEDGKIVSELSFNMTGVNHLD